MNQAEHFVDPEQVKYLQDREPEKPAAQGVYGRRNARARQARNAPGALPCCRAVGGVSSAQPSSRARRGGNRHGLRDRNSVRICHHCGASL